MSELGPSPIEADLQRNNERNFVNTLDTLAAHAEAIDLQTGEGTEGQPTTELLFVLREGSYDPRTVHETSVALGLDGLVTVVVTQEGSGVIVTAPISIGRFGEILDEHQPSSEALTEAVSVARDQATEEGQAFMGRTVTEVSEMIARPDTWRLTKDPN